jgi:hypothetical protein
MTRDLSCTYDASRATGRDDFEICADRLVVAVPGVMDSKVPAACLRAPVAKGSPRRGKRLPWWQSSVESLCGVSHYDPLRSVSRH